jgi:tetratricopeptide (TPR) repeat protein
MLIVLDGASNAEQVRPLIPGSPGCLVIVTSRSQLRGLVATEAAHPVTLTELVRQEARSLLAGRLGADRIGSQAPAVDDIIRSCAGLPLALAIVAARAAAQPDLALENLAADLRAARGSLDVFTVSDRAVEVRAVFSWSHRALSPPAARLFRMLALHPGPDLSILAAASLAGLPVSEARAQLAELCEANLINEHEPGRYAYHDLLRVYAVELGRTHDSPAEQQAARRRMFDYYLHTAYAGSLLLQAWEPVAPPARRPLVAVDDLADHRQALAWFTAEHHVLLSVVGHAAEAGPRGYSQRLAWTLSEYLYRRGHWHDWAHTLRTALDTVSAPAERNSLARLHRGLVRAYARMGRLDVAATHGRLAMDLAEQLGDKTGLAMSHRVLAILCEVEDRPAAALDHDLQALLLFQATGDLRGEARALNAVGWSYAGLGDHRAALDHCERALALLTELDDRQGLAATWDSLGYAHLRSGHLDEAVSCHREAVLRFQDLGDRYQEAESLAHLGDAYEAAADPDAARAVRREAMDILLDLGHPGANRLRAKLRLQPIA